MGRGRAKAKQVKVARQLKYGRGGMDLDRLQAELSVATNHRRGAEESADSSEYAELSERYTGEDDSGDEEDDEDWEAAGDYDTGDLSASA